MSALMRNPGELQKTDSHVPLAGTGLVVGLETSGYAFIDGATMRSSLDSGDSLADWPAFAASWNDLHLDGYMADGGRYRRRRHATFCAHLVNGIERQPHQAHFQSREYNPLNGDVERWFEPIDAAISAGASMTTILRWCHALFGLLTPNALRWHVEVHQFRIEASAGHFGQPTPEGMHRDGVDHVFVMLINRVNIASGTTTIHDLDGHLLGSFTLTQPFDAALVEDHRVKHGVTPVHALDQNQVAFRDVLVVTFRRG